MPEGRRRRRHAGRESPTPRLPVPAAPAAYWSRGPRRGRTRRSARPQFTSAFCRRWRGVGSSPQPPRPRCHGSRAAAAGPSQRPPRGDLPPRCLPCGSRRASAACSSFRRLIADHAFLRRYRSIHPPLLLGFVRRYGLAPAEAPHPSAAVARAVSFSFDYLPRTTRWDGRWNPVGARDGRVLLQCSRRKELECWDLLVCDPLSRGYLLLPPITDDLLASIGIQNQDIFHSGASLIRSGGIEEDTSFSVISWMQSSERLGVFIFSSGSGCWSVSTSISWDDLVLDKIRMFISEQCTDDCFYWKLTDMSTVVKLDMNSMRFCTIGLPPGHAKRQIVIVDSGESRVAMFSTIYQGTSVDYYTFSQNGSEKSHEWHLKSTIPASPCLPIILVKATLVVQLKDTFS